MDGDPGKPAGLGPSLCGPFSPDQGGINKEIPDLVWLLGIDISPVCENSVLGPEEKPSPCVIHPSRERGTEGSTYACFRPSTKA